MIQACGHDWSKYSGEDIGSIEGLVKVRLRGQILPSEIQSRNDAESTGRAKTVPMAATQR